MSRLVLNVVKSLKRRRKRLRREYRPSALLDAGRRLLAQQDQEQVSVALIAKEARCSVGSFYYIFPSKADFLDQLIADTLQNAETRAQTQFETAHWQPKSPSATVNELIEEMIRSLHGPTAGVIRAALKRGHLARSNLKGLSEYRAAMTGHALRLLGSENRTVEFEPAIRSSMQIVQAAILDALLNETDDLPAGSRRLATALSAVLLGALGLPSGKTAGSKSAPPSKSDCEDQLEMPVLDLVATSQTKRKVPRSAKASQITAYRGIASKEEGQDTTLLAGRHKLPRVTKRLRYL